MARDFYDNTASADVDDARRDVEHDDTQQFARAR